MKLKTVRALRQGFYDGHRRRAGAEFVVRADAREAWFEDVGPAPEGAELPAQLPDARAPNVKSFVEVMAQLGDKPVVAEPPKPMTVAEAQAANPPEADADLLS